MRLVGRKLTRGMLRPDPTTAHMPVDIVSNGMVARSVRDVAGFFDAIEADYRKPALPTIAGARRATDRRLRTASSSTPVRSGNLPPGELDAYEDFRRPALCILHAVAPPTRRTRDLTALGLTADARPISVMVSVRCGTDRLLLELAPELDSAQPYGRCARIGD